jgi:hypothetical protein
VLAREGGNPGRHPGIFGCSCSLGRLRALRAVLGRLGAMLRSVVRRSHLDASLRGKHAARGSGGP